MDPRGPSLLPAELPQVLRERSDVAAPWRGIVKAVQTTALPVQRDIEEDHSNAATYLTFFQGALGVVLFPHARRPQHAESL